MTENHKTQQFKKYFGLALKSFLALYLIWFFSSQLNNWVLLLFVIIFFSYYLLTNYLNKQKLRKYRKITSIVFWALILTYLLFAYFVPRNTHYPESIKGSIEDCLVFEIDSSCDEVANYIRNNKSALEQQLIFYDDLAPYDLMGAVILHMYTSVGIDTKHHD